MKTFLFIFLLGLTTSVLAANIHQAVYEQNLPTPHKYFLKGEVINIAKSKFTQEVETGAYLTKELYVKVKGQHKPGHQWGLDETVGIQYQIGKFTPYGEVYYDYDGKTEFTQWKKNGHYDLGLKRKLNDTWEVYAEGDDFAYDNREAQAGLNYKINDNYQLGIDYSYRIKTKHHQIGVSAVYSF